ncbi:hypothetical protein FRB91_009170 [Serendipita sp. 411]|nr:hypothetical protein FRB91_009170 [Serendipita sp. 411]
MEIRKLLSSNTSSPLVGIQGQGKLHSASRSTSSLAATPQSFARTPRLSQTSLEEPPSALAIPASVDPHVAGFLRSVLGTRKWRIFSSKLCERKDVASESSTFRGNEILTLTRMACCMAEHHRVRSPSWSSHAFSSSSSPPSVSWSSIGSSCGSPPPPSSSTQHSAQSGESEEAERRLAVARNFTGKGLDGLIAEIKRRSGASQFLRGRQSSLDPFGAHLESGSASYDPNWPIVMPSFHGKHTHSRASSDSYDFTSMTPLLTSPMSQPATTSSQGPSRTLLQSAYRMEPPKRYEKHSAMIMPHYDDSTPFMFPQSRQSYSRDSSGSPHSRASTAGSKRKREEDAFSSDEGCSTAVDVRRPTRLRAVSDLFRTRFSGGKRAKVDH